MQPPTITRLTEILNGNGAAPTLNEVQMYLAPQLKQALHISAAVEDRLREIEMRLRTDESRWQESLKSLLTPWRDELLTVEALGRSQILAHTTHTREPRCDCWRGARASYYEALDRWAGDRTAVAEFERVWDVLEELSLTHRRQQQEDIVANFAAAVSDTIEEQIASAMRDAAFLGRKRIR